MPTFAENLEHLSSVDAIAALELYGDGHTPEVVIENQPGSRGALAVYYHLAIQHGGITPKAAQEGLDLFAEHTEEARAKPGKHPNIDRLFQIIEEELFYSVKAIPKGSQ